MSSKATTLFHILAAPPNKSLNIGRLVITQILSKEVYQIKLREKVRAIRFG